MNMDNIVQCNGLSTEDKDAWDEKYPYYEPTKAGFIVHMSKKSNLPGVFTNKEVAEKAYRRYRGKILEADLVMKAKKKGK